MEAQTLEITGIKNEGKISLISSLITNSLQRQVNGYGLESRLKDSNDYSALYTSSAFSEQTFWRLLRTQHQIKLFDKLL